MKHMIWKIFGSKGSRKRMICGVLALVLVCASLSGCASKQPGVDAVPQEVLDTQTPEVSTQKNDEPTEVTDVTEAPKDTEAAEPETEPTEAPTEKEVKPTEPKATEAPKATEPKATEAPKPTEPKATEAPKPAHTHSYRDSVVAPTCTEKGYTKHACSCGFNFKDGWKDALGHSWVKGDTVAPTISAKGYTNYTCSRCSATKQDDWTDKLEVEKRCTEAAMQRICSRINAYVESIGMTVDASMAQSWASPVYLNDGLEWTENSVVNGICGLVNIEVQNGWTYFNAMYEQDADGGFWVYLKKG